MQLVGKRSELIPFLFQWISIQRSDCPRKAASNSTELDICSLYWICWLDPTTGRRSLKIISATDEVAGLHLKGIQIPKIGMKRKKTSSLLLTFLSTLKLPPYSYMRSSQATKTENDSTVLQIDKKYSLVNITKVIIKKFLRVKDKLTRYRQTDVAHVKKYGRKVHDSLSLIYLW